VFLSTDGVIASPGFYLFFELQRSSSTWVVVTLDLPTGMGGAASGASGGGGVPRASYFEVADGKTVFSAARISARIELPADLLGLSSTPCGCADGRLELLAVDAGPDGVVDTADDRFRRLSGGRFGWGPVGFCLASRVLDLHAGIEVGAALPCSPAGGSSGSGGGGGSSSGWGSHGSGSGSHGGGSSGEVDVAVDVGGCGGDESDFEDSGCEGDSADAGGDAGCDDGGSSSGCEGDSGSCDGGGGDLGDCSGGGGGGDCGGGDIPTGDCAIAPAKASAAPAARCPLRRKARPFAHNQTLLFVLGTLLVAFLVQRRRRPRS
jgi:hypothetical protein